MPVVAVLSVVVVSVVVVGSGGVAVVVDVAVAAPFFVLRVNPVWREKGTFIRS